MGNIFDFGGRDKMEQAIQNTWNEFRNCLSKGVFTYDEVDEAKKTIFLKTYDDLFHQHSGNTQKINPALAVVLSGSTIWKN